MTQIKHTRLASRAVARAVNAVANSLVLAETDRIWRIDIGTPDFCALDKTVSSANISPLSQGEFNRKKTPQTLTTPNHRGYSVSMTLYAL